MHNIFQKGCLVQISSSVWGATRKIPPGYMENMGASSEWLRANKKLVDPEALNPIRKIVNCSRIYLSKVSLPFPIPAMVFVPRETISTVDERLNLFKRDFDFAVQSFLEDYPALRKSAMKHLGELFNEIDYPSNINSKFSFTWRFITIDVPNGNTKLLAPEVYEREKEKFIETMDEARELAMAALREEFASHVERISDRFSHNPDGKRKIFKNGTINNFYEYFENFRQRNIFDDQELAELVNKAQSLLGNRSAESIREDDHLKDRIKKGMESIEDSLDSLITNSRRRIIMN